MDINLSELLEMVHFATMHFSLSHMVHSTCTLHCYSMARVLSTAQPSNCFHTCPATARKNPARQSLRVTSLLVNYSTVGVQSIMVPCCVTHCATCTKICFMLSLAPKYSSMTRDRAINKGRKLLCSGVAISMFVASCNLPVCHGQRSCSRLPVD